MLRQRSWRVFSHCRLRTVGLRLGPHNPYLQPSWLGVHRPGVYLLLQRHGPWPCSGHSVLRAVGLRVGLHDVPLLVDRMVARAPLPVGRCPFEGRGRKAATPVVSFPSCGCADSGQLGSASHPLIGPHSGSREIFIQNEPPPRWLSGKSRPKPSRFHSSSRCATKPRLNVSQKLGSMISTFRPAPRR